MIAYITTQGARLVKEGRRLIVCAGEERHTLFAHKLEQVILVGNVALTAPARSLLLAGNIDTVFMKTDGRYRGRLVSAHPANPFLRKRQFLLTDDLPFRLRVAKSIIKGKIENQAALLMRVRRATQNPELEPAIHSLRSYAGMIEEAESLGGLRGVEGAAAAYYFSVFGQGLHQDWGFRRRVRRPPPDPVNIVLSFLYTVLASRCAAALELAGLDTQPGILHELSYSRESLALDLMEEFRPLLADSLCLSLFNRHVLAWDDFSMPEPAAAEEDDMDSRIDDAVRDTAAGDAGAQPENSFQANVRREPPARLILGKKGVGSLLAAWSKKLETEFHNQEAGRRMSYGEAVEWQARALRRVIEGQQETYVPLCVR